MSNYLHRFLTQWFAEDPEPTYSALDRMDIRMGDIGEDQREIEAEPVEFPVQAPIEAPAEPEPVPSQGARQ